MNLQYRWRKKKRLKCSKNVLKITLYPKLLYIFLNQIREEKNVTLHEFSCVGLPDVKKSPYQSFSLRKDTFSALCFTLSLQPGILSYTMEKHW